MKEIPLTQGKVAIIDNDCFEDVVRFKWRAMRGKKTFYAVRTIKDEIGKTVIIAMHREILQLSVGDKMQGDHKDGDGLNNRRQNLRIASAQQNNRNRTIIHSKCGFKGVFSHKNGNFRAAITHLGKSIYIGYFATAFEAAKAYDKAALELHGEFAATNESLGMLKENP